MLKTIRRIFNKQKEKTKEIKVLDKVNNDNKILEDSTFLENNSGNTIKEETVVKVKRNIVRTRMNAYVIKNKEEDFRLIDYDVDSGEVIWIEGKLFNDFRNLERVRWSLSSGSATVFYGYVSEEKDKDKIVSYVYLMNAIEDICKNNNLEDIVYDIKERCIYIQVKDEKKNISMKFRFFSVCGVVEIEKQLNKIGLVLNRNY